MTYDKIPSQGSVDQHGRERERGVKERRHVSHHVPRLCRSATATHAATPNPTNAHSTTHQSHTHTHTTYTTLTPSSLCEAECRTQCRKRDRIGGMFSLVSMRERSQKHPGRSTAFSRVVAPGRRRRRMRDECWE